MCLLVRVWEACLLHLQELSGHETPLFAADEFLGLCLSNPQAVVWIAGNWGFEPMVLEGKCETTS